MALKNNGPDFGSRIEIKICQSSDPAVYNQYCFCSFFVKPDGERVLWGEKCNRCKRAIVITLPPLDFEKETEA